MHRRTLFTALLAAVAWTLAPWKRTEDWRTARYGSMWFKLAGTELDVIRLADIDGRFRVELTGVGGAHWYPEFLDDEPRTIGSVVDKFAEAKVIVI